MPIRKIIIPTVGATEVSDVNNTSTGAFDVPVGTTAQRPGSPNDGYTRLNTTIGSLEYYSNGNWIQTNYVPTISSITGNIANGAATTLTINITNATGTSTNHDYNNSFCLFCGISVTNDYFKHLTNCSS